jgi:16S rRNA (cytosine967-C5)-methyltransferase
MPISPARRAAFDILRRVEQENSYASVLLARPDGQLGDADRGLCHELVFGVLRRRLWLDRVLEHFAERDPEKLDLPVKLALRIGLYQIRFLTRIPQAAAVNESVSLVRAARLASAASFVNAVLRRATREPGYDPVAGVTEKLKRLAIETSHPLWLIERWAARFGAEATARLATANNNPAATSFRFAKKALETNQTETILNRFQTEGADLRPSKLVRNAWRVNGGTRLVRELSNAGLIYLQDEASQLVAKLIAGGPNERVLDVCAAPGSKATLIATSATRTTIVCGDVYEHRVRTIGELARRQGISNLQLIVHDATRDLPLVPESFDRVLVDTPCSGTGTLRRNPEIRWRITEADIAELSGKQQKILSNAAAVVRPGGMLCYSTCSIEIEEDEEIAEAFARNHPDFEPVRFDVPADLITDHGFVRTWPDRQDVDGFFIAGFRRVK